MSEIRLCVITETGSYTGLIHGSTGDRVIAACSHNPQTLDQLQLALGIYQRSTGNKIAFDLGLQPGNDATPVDCGVIKVDLQRKSIVVDSWYSAPTREGIVYWHNGSYRTPFQIPYCLGDDWIFLANVPKR